MVSMQNWSIGLLGNCMGIAGAAIDALLGTQTHLGDRAIMSVLLVLSRHLKFFIYIYRDPKEIRGLRQTTLTLKSCRLTILSA
jgi:hypothetical protein